MRSDYWGQGGHNAILLVGDFFRDALHGKKIDAGALFPGGKRAPQPVKVDTPPEEDAPEPFSDIPAVPAANQMPGYDSDTGSMSGDQPGIYLPAQPEGNGSARMNEPLLQERMLLPDAGSPVKPESTR